MWYENYKIFTYVRPFIQSLRWFPDKTLHIRVFWSASWSSKLPPSLYENIFVLLSTTPSFTFPICDRARLSKSIWFCFHLPLPSPSPSFLSFYYCCYYYLLLLTEVQMWQINCSLSRDLEEAKEAEEMENLIVKGTDTRLVAKWIPLR